MTQLEKQILAAAKEDPKSLKSGLKELKAETAREVVKDLFEFMRPNSHVDLEEFEKKVEKKYNIK